MLSETRDIKAARAFFRSAKTVTGITPTRVTTDGHDSYPRAIRSELGKHIKHRTSRYLTNRLEQDHRGIKGRCRPMRGFKCVASAARFCRGGCVPAGGVRAVGKWAAGATVQSLAEAGHLSTAVVIADLR